ncbi:MULTISPECIES: MFS transporter [Burkholderia]|jgi:sugar phosphate permease|uniref:MFS transporter n=2 Tax=Burkholderia contaminans TaxID=488447 RepID=A0A1E3FP86_9BURK|nr:MULTISPECIES: MFS transporter [Burkholderia]UTP26900.1 MFS transporter [Burkholderia sp. FXe9]KKL42664.1 major facilitator transporter [Burkholderia contaminans LMG 23361]MBA9831291.1 MFS transporter [Burkholderia contaminans]MBA9839543.1 MFS transporter [Burkholderia contaminans]MBA9864580.1 MFS transporter [Burkholderia contaminans]
MSESPPAMLYRRIALRVIPFLFVCYVINFIDRVNIGFAKLQFLQDLGLSEAVFGSATAIFFISYAAFEVPSNLVLARIGASRTLMRIMVLWGLCTVAQMFVTGRVSLYVVRFLLGAAEAGFFPGLILYLSYWFPDAVRARVNSVLLLAVPVAGMIGGPLSGWIMAQLQDTMGLRGWQWLFLIEGLPAIALGLVAPLMLSDRPERAAWLSPADRQALLRDLDAERASAVVGHDRAGVFDIVRNARVLGLAAIYFCVYVGMGTVTFWSPTVLKAAGVASVTGIGWLSGLISVFTMIGNVAIAWSSDRYGERRWHTVACMLVTACSLLLLRFSVGHVAITVALLAIAQLCAFTVPIVFWTIPAAQLTGRAAAAGIAVISMLGSLGGAFSSWLVGVLFARTGAPYAGFAVVAGLLVVGAVLVTSLVPRTLPSRRTARERAALQGAE